eukprot:UN08747
MSRITLHDRITSYVDKILDQAPQGTTVDQIFSLVETKFKVHKDWKQLDKKDLKYLIDVMIIAAAAEEFADENGKVSHVDVFRIFSTIPK